MPRARNTCQEYDTSYQRILDELEVLGRGGSDDIFQTSASPFGHEQVQLNDAININEPTGFAASISRVKHLLESLLPVEREVRPAEYTPPQLMDDLVEHFRLVVSKMPKNEHPVVNLQREKSELAEFIDDVWTGKACQFSDELLRRLRPHIPLRWDLNCKLAQCLVERGVCDVYEIPLEAIGQDEEKKYYGFKNREDSDANPIAFTELFMVTVYLSRLSIKIAAWLAYELMHIQAQKDQRIHRAFIDGARYDFYLVSPDSDTFSDPYWHVCLGHVLKWLEHRDWHRSILGSDEGLYRQFFWEAIDEGVDDYILNPDNDLENYPTVDGLRP
ncbi:MAG: hypothetical protein Q9211_000286 [Gyalolechia sp. 1 TL-2023]